jgi:hypothetical protein
MIFLTTTAIDLDEELMNRCLVLTVNEDREQTKAIHQKQRESQTLEGLLRRQERAAILDLHRNAQRLLKPVAVVNPYAENLTYPATPLDTARRLVQMPTGVDELPLAQEALRLGDREMDLAFAAAASEARMHPVVLSAEAKQIQARLQNPEKSLDGDNARVTQLTAALTKATGAKQDSLDDQLAQAKVQAELDQDEVDNAKQELTRAGAADCNAYRYASE